jgi:hypothetical protein
MTLSDTTPQRRSPRQAIDLEQLKSDPASFLSLAACRRGTNNDPSANKTRDVFTDRPTPEWVKTL